MKHKKAQTWFDTLAGLRRSIRALDEERGPTVRDFAWAQGFVEGLIHAENVGVDVAEYENDAQRRARVDKINYILSGLCGHDRQNDEARDPQSLNFQTLRRAIEFGNLTEFESKLCWALRDAWIRLGEDRRRENPPPPPDIQVVPEQETTTTIDFYRSTSRESEELRNSDQRTFEGAVIAIEYATRTGEKTDQPLRSDMVRLDMVYPRVVVTNGIEPTQCEEDLAFIRTGTETKVGRWIVQHDATLNECPDIRIRGNWVVTDDGIRIGYATEIDLVKEATDTA